MPNKNKNCKLLRCQQKSEKCRKKQKCLLRHKGHIYRISSLQRKPRKEALPQNIKQNSLLTFGINFASKRCPMCCLSINLPFFQNVPFWYTFAKFLFDKPRACALHWERQSLSPIRSGRCFPAHPGHVDRAVDGRNATRAPLSAHNLLKYLNNSTILLRLTALFYRLKYLQRGIFYLCAVGHRFASLPATRALAAPR